MSDFNADLGGADTDSGASGSLGNGNGIGGDSLAGDIRVVTSDASDSEDGEETTLRGMT
jgi:hypothetical protein